MLCSRQSSWSSASAAVTSRLMTCVTWVTHTYTHLVFICLPRSCLLHSCLPLFTTLLFTIVYHAPDQAWSLSCAAAACRRGGLSSLLVLDLSFNGSVGDNGWSALFAAGGLGSLEDLDLSLRPLTSASCSAWLPSLLRALPRLSVLTRLAAQRWTMSSQDRQQLSNIVRKRSILLEFDPPTEEASLFKATYQESPEAAVPEESGF